MPQQGTNRPGHRILRQTKEQFEANAVQAKKDGNGIIGKRIAHRRAPLEAARTLEAEQRRLRDRIAREAKEVAPKGKPGPTPVKVKAPPAPPAGTDTEPSVRDSIAAIRAVDSDLGALLTAELAHPSGPRKRVLEGLLDELEARALPVPATLEEALGSLLDPK